MRHRLPWALTLPLALAGSWFAHVVGRAMAAGSAEGSEVAEHLERSTTANGGATALGVAAVLAPFAAVALIVIAAWLWTRTEGRSWRGAGPGWFLILPAMAYITGELLERLIGGGRGALSLHVTHEPGLLLAVVLQAPFGAVAYVIARLLLAAARAIVAKVRRSVPAPQRSRRADVKPVTWIAPERWSCLVGAHGLRGPPVVLPS